MGLRLIEHVLRLSPKLGRNSGAFVRAARARGMRPRSAKILEAAALAVSPSDPALILESRPLFEEAATRAVVGDGGNLELSFGLVDELANTVEALGLARASDVPDPFRRVWVSNAGGQRIRGVVLTCRAGELAVFCPPTERALAEIGGVLWLGYRGFSSSVEYDLVLDDSVRLPGALVLHLKRRSGSGAIGRASVRYPANIRGSLRLLDEDAPESGTSQTCIVTDISMGGMALACANAIEQGSLARIEFPLADDVEAPFTAEVVVRWSRAGEPDEHLVGVEFSGLARPRVERLDRFLHMLSTVLPAEDAQQQLDSSGAVPSFSHGEEEAREPRGVQPHGDSTEAFAIFDEEDRGQSAPLRMEDEGACSPASMDEKRQLDRTFQQICHATTIVTDQVLNYSDTYAERRVRRVAGGGGVHISFRFALMVQGTEQEGCLLIPLGDSIALASAYSMLPYAEIVQNRSRKAPDKLHKRALMHLGGLFSDAIQRGLQGLPSERCRVRPLGCQGVRANIRPAFAYSEGADLLVGRCTARFADFPPFEMILMLPSSGESAA